MQGFFACWLAQNDISVGCGSPDAPRLKMHHQPKLDNAGIVSACHFTEVSSAQVRADVPEAHLVEEIVKLESKLSVDAFADAKMFVKRPIKNSHGRPGHGIAGGVSEKSSHRVSKAGSGEPLIHLMGRADRPVTPGRVAKPCPAPVRPIFRGKPVSTIVIPANSHPPSALPAVPRCP